MQCMAEKLPHLTVHCNELRYGTITVHTSSSFSKKVCHTKTVLKPTQTGADAVAVMVSRICGILGGVLISLFLSVLIFPTSASQKATNGLAEGLQALTTLSSMAWGKEGKDSAAAGGG